MAMTLLSRTSLSWYPWALALALWLLWGAGCTEVKSASRQETPTAPAASVTIVQVNPRAVPVYKEYTGSTDATETAEIRARVDGFIEQRLFDAGQLVKANQLLYVLDQGIYRAEWQKTKAAVAKAEADLRFATEREGVEVLRAESRLTQSRAALVKADRDVARYRSLVKQEAAPQQDLDVALAQQQVLREDVNLRKAELEQTKLQQRTQIALAAAELEYARAAQRLAELNRDYTEIKAPVAGRIGASNILVGGLATKASPQPLTLISPLDPIQVRVKIGEREYLNFVQKAGDEAERDRRAAELAFQLLLADGSVYKYPGRVRSADRAVDPQTGTLEITLDFPNHDLVLLPGKSSRVRVPVGEKSGVFLVPQRVVRELQGVRSVYLVDNQDTVVARTVTAGDRLGDLWVIEKGLEAGDRVIVEGLQRVQPGVRVQYKVEPEPKLELAADPTAR
jgi:membrane fusion protein (multidrug efflux system)